MAVMTAVMMGMQAAGTILQAVGAHNAGEAQKAEATQVANQEKQAANNAEGAAEVRSQQEDLKTQYVLSNERAAAAASGGTSTDPTVTNVMSQTVRQGKLNALSTLYSGQSEAQGLRNRAADTLYSGRLAAREGNLNAFSTILTGGSKIAATYGNFGGSNLGSNNFSTTPDYSNIQPNNNYPPFMTNFQQG